METDEVWYSSSFLAFRCPFITYKLARREDWKEGEEEEGGGEEGW